MRPEERPLILSCDGLAMVGVLHPAGTESETGVVVVVGGPQTRVGSHRQFLLLARALAANGIPTLRFDYRGMGDSEGEFAGFEAIGADIRAAVDCLLAEQPGIKRVVLWGLCDAASASMMYAPSDERVAGMVLLNPWMRTEEGHSRTLMRSYYLRQIASKEFWSRLVRGNVRFGTALSSFANNVKSALGVGSKAEDPEAGQSYTERMLTGLSSFDGAVMVILSGEDLTAAEFEQKASESKAWRRALKRPTIRTTKISDATHTFSSAAWRGEVEALTLEAIQRANEHVL